MKHSKHSSKAYIFILVGALVIAGAFFGFNHYQKNDSTGVVVAHINGKPVHLAEANDQVAKVSNGKEGVSFDVLDEASKLVIIKQIAARRVILAEGNKSGVVNTPEVKEKLAQYRDKMVEDAFLAKKAKEAISEDKIKERYDSLLKNLAGKTQYKVRHILVKSEDTANEAARRAKAEGFEKIAKRESIDNQTAAIGGDLGYLLSGNMIKEFESVITKMSIGDISAPFKTKFGWHVIKLEDKRNAESLPFEKVHDSVARDMYNEHIQEYVKGLIDKADIELVVNESDEKKPAASVATPTSSLEKSDSDSSDAAEPAPDETSTAAEPEASNSEEAKPVEKPVEKPTAKEAKKEPAKVVLKKK